MAGAVMVLVYRSGNYPAGSDTMLYVYRGDVIYQSVQNGNWLPILDPNWYNGMEFFCYQAPFPAYVMALCQFCGGGNLFNAYLWYTGLVLFLGAVSWLVVGIARKRILLGAFLGMLWFFLPNNLLVYFWEGNLARALCMAFLPLFFHFLHAFLHEERKQGMYGLMLTAFFTVMCDRVFAGMVLLTLLLYLLCYLAMFGKYKRALLALGTVVSGFLWSGIWLFASVMAEKTAGSSAQSMKWYFQSIWTSLNPFYRITHGQGVYYFGLAAAFLAVAGIVLGKRKSAPGFLTGILLLLLSMPTVYLLLSRLPGSRYMLMLQFISVAACLILLGFLLWDSLKTPFVIAMCLLLLLDTIPSLVQVYGDASEVTAEQQLDMLVENTLLDHAKEITVQRLAFLDGSATGAKGAFAASSYGQKTLTTFGADWQGADTAQNVMQLNQAAERGYYTYLFDRCLELGTDTVLIDVKMLQNKQDDLDAADEAAERLGYSLAGASAGYRLYHLDCDTKFGVITSYDAVAIGTATEDFSLLYPAFAVGASSNVNDYSFDELVQYKLIFLDGFTFDNKSAAEEMLIRLSEAGVRVVISADGMPADEKTGVSEFLGVGGYSVQFSNGYPMIETPDDTLDLDLFPAEHASWRTVYVNGLDECWAYLEDKGETLEFYGTVKNDNIVFVGLNLVYHAVLTKDRTAIELLSKAMEPVGTEDVPTRVPVPVDIRYDGNAIRIETEYDNVNTCVAYHDSMEVKGLGSVREENNLTYVNAGVTEIEIRYSYFWQGLAVSLAGIALSLVLRKRVGDQ